MDDVDASERLAVYGSLAPGRSNHHVLRGLTGTWRPGIVHGHLHQLGWGADLGHPAIVIDSSAPAVPVMVLTSVDLPAAWPRLDEFEGPAYRRRLVTTDLDDGTTVSANIYELEPSQLRPEA